MAKAYLFSDLHASTKNLQKMYDFIIQNKGVSAIICAGDIVNMGEPVWFMEKFIKVLDQLKLTFLWAPGNNDFGRAYYKLNSKYKSVEGRVVQVPLLEKERLGEVIPQTNISFTGVGGSPASWAGQYAGEDMVDKKKIGGSIFVSHFPPPGILTLHKYDDLVPNQSTGRCFSDSPLVHICGHLHYRFGVAYLGQTKVIQLASLEMGRYAIMDLENLKVEFERLK